MSDAGRELSELKREVVETRNQAIKTDNQIKNLALDVKGFEQRFQGLEKRAQLAGVGVNLIVAGTIAIAATIASGVRARSFESDIDALKAAVKEAHATAQSKSEELHTRLAEAEKERRNHEQASDVAAQLVTLMDNKQDKEAGDLLDKLNINHLTTLERKLVEKRFLDLRHREAEAKFKSGRNLVLAARPEVAVPDLRRALALEPDARFAPQARFLLATSLYGLKRYEEAEPLLRELVKAEADKLLLEEARHDLAGCLARSGHREEAKTLFTQVATGGGRFAVASKAYLAAIESGSELPTDLPGGRIRLARKAEGAQLSEAVAQ